MKRLFVLAAAMITTIISYQKEEIKKAPIVAKQVQKIYLEPLSIMIDYPTLVAHLKEKNIYTEVSVQEALVIAKSLKAQKIAMQHQTGILFFTNQKSAGCPVMVSLWYDQEYGYAITSFETYGPFSSWHPGNQVACLKK